MTTPKTIIALSAPVQIEAGDSKRVPTFEAVIYTGGALQLANWDMPVVIDLVGIERGNVLVANLDHVPSQRVGNFDVENDGSKLKAIGTASAATRARDEVVNSAKAGYVWQASVEVQPTMVEPINAGESVTINGRSFSGPMYVTRRGILKGFAFCSHGADDDTSVRIAAANRRKQAMSANSDFLNWANECEVDTSLMTADQLADLRANYRGSSKANDEDREAVLPLIAASADDPVVNEKRRLRQIAAACDDDFGDEAGRVQELKAQAIGGELTVDNLITALREIRVKAMTQKINSTLDGGDFPCAPVRGVNRSNIEAQVIEATFAIDAGLANPEKFFHEQVLDAADKRRGTASITQLILQAAAQNGESVRHGEQLTQGNLDRMLRAAFPPIKAAGFSTLSLPNLFSNVTNKYLRDGWDAVDQTILRISAVRAVKDFREIKTVSLTGGMQFLPIRPDGELKHGQLGELAYGNKIDTFGVIVGLTRVDIINDDISALTSVPRRIGRGAMLKLNDLGWTEFLDNGSFFTSGNNNVNTGVADMTVGGLAATEAIFLSQRDPDGSPLGLMPQIILVPTPLRAAAMTLMASESVWGGSSVTPSANVWRGRFRVESSPYLSDSAYTGYSAQAWYMLADPNQLPVLEVAALNGNVMPTVETAQPDFATLGILMRGFSDVGVRLQEYRAGVRSDGGSS